MTMIKLHNKGLRTIETEGPEAGTSFFFKPNMTVEFPKDQANKLRSLYKGEVIGEEEALTPFTAAPVEQEPEPEVVVELTDEQKEEARKKAVYDQAVAEGFNEAEAKEIAYGKTETEK